MDHYFGEKSAQLDPGVIYAFGIRLESRYSRADEMAEMLEFAQLVALSNVAHYVKEVFYDSKASSCSFTIDPAVREGDLVAVQIVSAASKKISHYDDLLGDSQYGF